MEQFWETHSGKEPVWLPNSPKNSRNEIQDLDKHTAATINAADKFPLS